MQAAISMACNWLLNVTHWLLRGLKVHENLNPGLGGGSPGSSGSQLPVWPSAGLSSPWASARCGVVWGMWMNDPALLGELAQCHNSSLWPREGAAISSPPPSLPQAQITARAWLGKWNRDRAFPMTVPSPLGRDVSLHQGVTEGCLIMNPVRSGGPRFKPQLGHSVSSSVK